MGMAYQFKVAKKSDIPNGVKFYEDAYENFIDVGPEFDREDWLPSFIRECSSDKASFTREGIEKAIATLEKLDEEVKYILESKDISLDIDFRRRLAKGLVSNIYGYREYHYDYPKNYYPEDSWQFKNWFDDNSVGSKHIQDALKLLLPYANDEHVIWCNVY